MNHEHELAIEAIQNAKILPAPQWVQQIADQSGQPISRCYQCKKCSCGCPMAFAMDLLPHQLVRLVQLGVREQVLRSRTIWVCAACRTCYSRCPNGIDVAAVADCLKGHAQQAGVQADANIPVFHQAFVNSVKRYGRVYELGMLGSYKLKTKTYQQDMDLGLKMFRHGKLKLLPTKIKGKQEIREIFRRAKEKSHEA